MVNVNSHIDRVFQIIKDRNLRFIYNDSPISLEFHTSTEKLRNCLVKVEQAKYPDGQLPQISTNNPLKLSPKYQIDFLGIEIPQIYNQYCVSLASAHYYFPFTSDISNGYFYKKPDLFFWNNIDSGFRFASSGWDRISLLFNIAFNLKVKKYSLGSVLKAIPTQIDNISNDKNFNYLKEFRNGRFSDLEFKLGGGARHESTHVISRSTRFFLELSEQYRENSDFGFRREKELNLLEEHLNFLFEGIQMSYALVKDQFNEKYYD